MEIILPDKKSGERGFIMMNLNCVNNLDVIEEVINLLNDLPLSPTMAEETGWQANACRFKEAYIVSFIGDAIASFIACNPRYKGHGRRVKTLRLRGNDFVFPVAPPVSGVLGCLPSDIPIRPTETGIEMLI